MIGSINKAACLLEHLLLNDILLLLSSEMLAEVATHRLLLLHPDFTINIIVRELLTGFSAGGDRSTLHFAGALRTSLL